MVREFGIWDHFEQQDPERVPLTQQYAERLELIVEAERLGFSRYHIAEHHLRPLDMAPSPNVGYRAAVMAVNRITARVLLSSIWKPEATATAGSATRNHPRRSCARSWLAAAAHHSFGNRAEHVGPGQVRGSDFRSDPIGAFYCASTGYKGHSEAPERRPVPGLSAGVEWRCLNSGWWAHAGRLRYD
jgi:hypothetical protein